MNDNNSDKLRAVVRGGAVDIAREMAARANDGMSLTSDDCVVWLEMRVMALMVAFIEEGREG